MITKTKNIEPVAILNFAKAFSKHTSSFSEERSEALQFLEDFLSN